MKRIVLILCLFFVTFLTTKSQNVQDSTLKMNTISASGYVNDFQNLLTPEQKDTLETLMSDFEKKTSIEFCLVTFYVDPQDYNPDDVIDLAKRWGVGKSNLNNGFIMFLSYSNVKGMSNYNNLTGYGLEAFLPDGTLSNLKYKIYPETLYKGLVYEAYKQFIVACQDEIGYEGYEMLVENKRLDKIKREEAQEAFLMWFLRVAIGLLILGVIIYLILLRRRKRKEFSLLKLEIQALLGNIEDIKKQVGTLPTYYQEQYDNRIKLTDKLVTLETKSNMLSIYNQLHDYKSTINSIKHSTESINKSKTDISKYLSNNYPFCESFLKDELNNMLKFSMPTETDFTKKRMNALLGIESLIDRKLKTFLGKTVKIENIINDKNNIKTKIDELGKLNSEYIRKKTILSSVNIGDRVLGSIDFYGYTTKIKNNIDRGYDFLLNDNLDSALNYYGQSITEITLLKSKFSKIDSLFVEYNKCYKYIQKNKTVLELLVSDSEAKVNRSGVSYNRRSNLQDIKNDIEKNKKLILVDVILAASSMALIISDAESLLSSIKYDISSYIRKQEEDERRRQQESSSSSGSDFGGFGGGDFGGGGNGGSF